MRMARFVVLLACVATQCTPLGALGPVSLTPEGHNVHVRKGDPPPGAAELGAVEVGDGTYCTPQDAPNGTYRRALVLLRNAAALKGANYVELVSVTEPHQQTWQCYDHRYMIQAMAFRLPAARQKPAADAPETEDDACDPPCSPGYACEDSECVAVCNPECSADQTCRKDRTCGPAD